MEPLHIALIAIGAVVLSAVFFAVGIAYRKRVGEREIGSAEAEATRLINEAIRSGESRKKEMLLEAKDEIHKSRTEYEKEVKERRAELSKQERHRGFSVPCGRGGTQHKRHVELCVHRCVSGLRLCA